jgi:hypothetical protein
MSALMICGGEGGCRGGGGSTFPYFNMGGMEMNMVLEKKVFLIGRIGISDST